MHFIRLQQEEKLDDVGIQDLVIVSLAAKTKEILVHVDIVPTTINRISMAPFQQENVILTVESSTRLLGIEQCSLWSSG